MLIGALVVLLLVVGYQIAWARWYDGLTEEQIEARRQDQLRELY